MSVLKVVIVEDEPLAVERLELALNEAPAVEVVGSALDGRSGLELIRELRPDLVFLDIKMPGLDGLELAGILAREGGPAVIFLTAFGQFAVNAFELAAVDYLMKPVGLDRVRAAVERARDRLEATTAAERARQLQTLVETLRPQGGGEAERSLWITDARGRVRVPLSAIEWVEAERDYVRIHTGSESRLMRMTLNTLSGKLDPGQFLRVHRSAVVNLGAVTGLKRRTWGLVSVRLASGAEVPVGRPQLRELKARLGVNAKADAD